MTRKEIIVLPIGFEYKQVKSAWRDPSKSLYLRANPPFAYIDNRSKDAEFLKRVLAAREEINARSDPDTPCLFFLSKLGFFVYATDAEFGPPKSLWFINEIEKIEKISRNW